MEMGRGGSGHPRPGRGLTRRAWSELEGRGFVRPVPLGLCPGEPGIWAPPAGHAEDLLAFFLFAWI